MSDQNEKKFARRAAIAAVMSRNLAHNTGSHKAPWLKFFINDRFERIHDYLEKYDIGNLPQVYRELIDSRKNLESAITQQDESKRELYSRTLTNQRAIVNEVNNELLYYFDFFNANMEFIADVTTMFDGGRASFEISANDLIDEFVEQQFIRAGLVDDYYFLDNSDKPKIKVEFNNDGGRYEKLSIPNGHLGRVAFLILIENFIRNFYKHSNIKNGIDLWFRFGEFDDNYLYVDLFDNNGDLNSVMRNEKLLEDINKTINESIVNNENTLRQEGWGLFEMKICAAYLVDFPLDYIDEKVGSDGYINTSRGKFLPLIKAHYYSNNGQNFKIDPMGNNLGYRFYLKRPKKIYIDKRLIENLDTLPIDNLKKSGIVFGEIDSINKDKFNIYEMVLAHKVKINLIDKNQRFLYVDDTTFNFELKTDQNIIISYTFNKWLEKITAERRGNEIGTILWENYLKQKKYKLNHYDFFIIRTDQDLAAIKEKFPNVKSQQLIIIDYHGKDVTSIGGKDFENLKKYLWYVPEDSQTREWIRHVLVYFQASTFNQKLYFTEIINIQIGIFDERIQQETAFKYRNNKELTISNLLSLNGIHVTDNNTIDLTGIMEEEVDLLEKMLQDSLEKNHYTILHYTIFERLARFKGFKNNVDGLTKYYKELVGNESKNTIVFCSGRGRPSNLIEGCYYIHLSTLRDILIRIRSKYHLVHALKSLRKTFNNSIYA